MVEKEHTVKVDRVQSKNVQVWLGYVAILVAVCITVVVSWILYQHTVTILVQNLREREIAIVRTAAVQFDVKDLDRLRMTDDWKKPEWKKVTLALRDIRANNPDIVFAYILRRSPADPTKMLFVADADSLDPFAKIDLNHDGTIDDADALVTPGEEYEDVPVESFDGLSRPTANAELYKDQWGWLISGYAPILDDQGHSVAVVAVDLRADNFYAITRQTFLPFLAVIAILLTTLLVLSACLIWIWRKQLIQLEEIDRQKDELISIVSHQLASPISSVQWNLQDILDGDFGPISEKLKTPLEQDKRTTANLLDLAELLLDVSRIELGRLKMNKQRQSLVEFFQEIIAVIEPKAKEKNVAFTYSLLESLPEGTFDKRLTHMTIENLLTNAVNYTPTGGKVELTVAMRGNILSCIVKDTGIGIPKKDQAQLFGKLFRASNVGKIDGNGFGLYVAKGAIEQQGGTIHFESEESKGTTFFVELPV